MTNLARPSLVEPFDSRLRPLTSGLESCGLAAVDTAQVLSLVASGTPLEEVSKRISQGSLLQKRSTHGRKHVLAAIRKRYLRPPKPLPEAGVLAQALQAVTALVTKNQLVLPYLLSSDQAAYEVIVAWLPPRMVAGERLSANEIAEELDRIFLERSKPRWSASMRLRWAQGVLSVLRDVGAVGRGRSRERYLPYLVRPEAFAFHLMSLFASGSRGPQLVSSPFWRMLLLDEEATRQAVRSVVERGWWRHTQVGGVDEILPTWNSIEDWIAYGLG